MQAIGMSSRRGEVRWEWIGDAWKLFTVNPGAWIGMMLIALVVALIAIGLPSFMFIVPAIMTSGREPTAASIAAVAGTALLALIVVFVLALLVGSFLTAGFYRAAINQARGQSISVGDLFSGGDCFLSVLGLLVLTAIAEIAILVGFSVFGFISEELGILGSLAQTIFRLVIQGFLFYAIPLIVDRKVGVIEAIQTSIKTTKSQWWMYTIFILVLSLLMVVGVIPCGLGLFVTVPLFFLATAVGYRDTFLSQRSEGYDAYSSPPPPSYYTPQAQYSNPPISQYSNPPQPQYPAAVPPTQQYPASSQPPVSTPPPDLHSQETQLIGKPCPSCGATINRVANFCNQCGSPLSGG